MDGRAIIFTPSEFDRFLTQMREQVSKELAGFKSMVVERPFTTKEAADFLSIHEKTLLTRIKSGSKLPFHREGKVYYFFPSELTEYLKSKGKQK